MSELLKVIGLTSEEINKFCTEIFDDLRTLSHYTIFNRIKGCLHENNFFEGFYIRKNGEVKRVKKGFSEKPDYIAKIILPSVKEIPYSLRLVAIKTEDRIERGITIEYLSGTNKGRKACLYMDREERYFIKDFPD